MNRISGLSTCAIPCVVLIVMLVIIFTGATAIAIVTLVAWVVSAVVGVGVVAFSYRMELLLLWHLHEAHVVRPT